MRHKKGKSLKLEILRLRAACFRHEDRASTIDKFKQVGI